MKKENAISRKLFRSGAAWLMFAMFFIALLTVSDNVYAVTSYNLSINDTWAANDTITNDHNIQYYKITLPGDGKLTVTLQSWINLVGFKLFDEDLTKTYASGNLSKGKVSEPVANAMADMYLKSGTYYVQIFQYTGYTGYSYTNTGEYRLKATFENGNTTETEPNDKASSAIDLNAKKSVTGMMWVDDEYDYYKFKVNGTEPVIVKVTSWMTHIAYGVRTSDQMTASDTDGKEIGDGSVGKGSETEPIVKELEFKLAKGDYYLFLKKYTNYTGYSYQNTGIYKIELVSDGSGAASVTNPAESNTDANKTNSDAGKTSGDANTTNNTDSSGTNTSQSANRISKGSIYTVSDLIYKIINPDLNGNGTAALIGTTTKKTKFTKLNVPAIVKIQGASFKVVEIAAKAFKGYTKLKTVTVGKNVATIGKRAFYGDTALTKVTLGAGLQKLGKSAFSGCKKLKTIKIKSSKLSSVGNYAIKKINSSAVIKLDFPVTCCYYSSENR